MVTLVDSISGVLIILVIVMMGYVLAKEGWFSDQIPSLVVKLVTKAALPYYMIYTIIGRFAADELLKMPPQLRPPAPSMIILLTITMAVTQLLAVDKRHQGLFVSMSFNSNTIFMGLSINQALFGDKSIPYVLAYYMCSTTFFWAIGTYFIQKDGRHSATTGFRDSLRKISSPSLSGFIVRVTLVLLDIQLPTFLFSGFQYLSNPTIPLSMIFIGIPVANTGLSRLCFSKDNVLVLLGRLVVVPLLMTVIVGHTRMPSLMRQVFIIQSAIPVMTNAPVVTKLYEADADYAVVMVTKSTLLAMLIAPILMYLVDYLQSDTS